MVRSPARQRTRSVLRSIHPISQRLHLRLGSLDPYASDPVMIVPYAGTFSSCMEYVNAYYKELIEDGEDLPLTLSEIRKTLTPYVAKHIWAAHRVYSHCGP